MPLACSLLGLWRNCRMDQKASCFTQHMYSPVSLGASLPPAFAVRGAEQQVSEPQYAALRRCIGEPMVLNTMPSIPEVPWRVQVQVTGTPSHLDLDLDLDLDTMPSIPKVPWTSQSK